MKKPVLSAFLLTFCPVALSHAAVIKSTGFEAGDPTLTGAGSGGAQIIASTPDFGTGSQILRLNASGGFLVRTGALSTLSSFSFDMYEPTGTAGNFRFGIGAGDVNAASGYANWDIDNGAITTGSNTSLASGSLAVLSLDTLYTGQVLYNGSGSTQMVQIPGAALTSIAAGQTALFFYNPDTDTTIDGGRFSHTASVTPTQFMFRAFSNDDNLLLVDNFVYSDTLTLVSAAVPEPRMAGLVCVAALLTLMCRRRSAR